MKIQLHSNEKTQIETGAFFLNVKADKEERGLSVEFLGDSTTVLLRSGHVYQLHKFSTVKDMEDFISDPMWEVVKYLISDYR